MSKRYSKKKKQELIDLILPDIEVMVTPLACKKHGLPYSTFRLWIGESKDLVALHARAKSLYIEQRVGEMQEILDAPPVMNEKGSTDHGEVQLRKLRVETIKWELARLAPKKYGDRLTLAGDEDSPVVVTAVELKVIDHKAKQIEDGT